MHGFTLSGACALALTAFCGTGARANPVYSLTIADSAGSYTTTDSGTGLISYTGTLGGFSISALTVQDLNPNNPFDIAFGSQDIFRASGSDALQVYVTVSNLSAALPQVLTIGTTSQANFQGSKIMGWSSQTYFDAGDHTGTAGLVSLLSDSSGNAVKNAFTSTREGAAMLAATPFSYTVDFTLDLLSNQFANGAGATTDVILSEPGSGTLMAGSLLALLLVRRSGRRPGAVAKPC